VRRGGSRIFFILMVRNNNNIWKKIEGEEKEENPMGQSGRGRFLWRGSRRECVKLIRKKKSAYLKGLSLETKRKGKGGDREKSSLGKSVRWGGGEYQGKKI